MNNQHQLNIFEDVYFDDTIVRKEFHTYLPFIRTYSNNDEIRIVIQSQDIFTLPSESFLHLQGKLTSTDADAKLCNNAYAYLFDEIRIEVNGVEVDRVHDVGNTTTIKGVASFTENELKSLAVAGWCKSGEKNPTLISKNFDVCIPLRIWLGIFEFYNKILINCKLELVLIRSHTDDNAIIAKDGTIELTKIEWHVPHVHVNDETRLKINKKLKENKNIMVPFQRWELYEIPELRQTSFEKWSIRNKSQLEKPRFLLVAFQTDKRNNKVADASNYDHNRIRNLKLYLNDTYYPYDKQNYDFGQGIYAGAYYDYIQFQKKYYGREICQPMLSYAEFKDNPIFLIYTNHQLDSLVTSTVDIQLEMEADVNFAKKTSIFAVIIHDSLFEYNAMTGIVNRVI